MPPAAPPRRSHMLYEPLDTVLVRAPLLPIERFLTLGPSPDTSPPDDIGLDQDAGLAPRDPLVLAALALGSPTLLQALERGAPAPRQAARLQGKLLRFLIRMSTRPTPYGL